MMKMSKVGRSQREKENLKVLIRLSRQPCDIVVDLFLYKHGLVLQ